MRDESRAPAEALLDAGQRLLRLAWKILVAGDARRVGFRGVAVMAREGPWMAGRGLFIANGFEAVDATRPDYELLVRKLRKNAGSPRFPRDWDRRGEYGIQARVVNFESSQDAQNAPTPYATFSLIYNGRLLADHQISRTRFRNIMNRLPTTS